MKNLKIYLLAAICCSLFSCEKDFLEKKPDKSLLVPTTVEDLQSLLDNNDGVMNVAPALGEMSSDNFYTNHAGLQGLFTDLEKGAYLWNMAPSQTSTNPDWDNPYKQVFYTNVVLEGVKDLKDKPSPPQGTGPIEGAALFFRSLAFYNLLQEFAPPYDKATAGSMPGIPVRLTADVNDGPGRGTVEQTYARILSDLGAAVSLLPEQVKYKSRPSKAAALALLARIHLTRGEYDQALHYASEALKLNSQLIDYNSLSQTAARPFPVSLPANNAEMIFYSRFTAYSFYFSSLINVDSTLYRSYAAEDLRKTVFFNRTSTGMVNFKGHYTGNSDVFSGIATDELYLIKAECLVRTGNVTEAVSTLNSLLVKRWRTGTYLPIASDDANEVLGLILQERRKELISRGLRWADLRRLNKDPKYAVTLSRNVEGEVYTLPANDKRYTLLIPMNEIATNNIEQND